MPLVVVREAAEQLLNRIREHEGDFGLDVETSGLNPRKNHIVAYVLSFGVAPNDHYYIPVRHGGGGNLQGCSIPTETDNWKGDDHWFEVEFRKIAADKTWNLIGHNLAYDLLMCARHKIFFNNSTFSCTQVGQALVDEFSPGFSLDASSRHMNVTVKKGDALYARLAELFEVPAERKSMGHYWRTCGTEPLVVDYALGDGVSTMELYHAQQKRIAEEELQRVWKLEQRTTRTLFRMQHRGIRVDVERLLRTKEYMGGMADQMREEFNQIVGEEFNERKNKHMEMVFKAHGVSEDDFQRTATGRSSFVEEWMENYPVGEKILALRKASNLVNSFINPLIDHQLVGDRVHPNYNQLRGDDYGTISGRLSSNDPNIQQVPKHNERMSKIFRANFIPSDGRIWSSNDAKQCEPRIFAQYTKSPFLISGYNQTPTIDLYTALSQVTGASRQQCKKLALALFYGAGNAKAAVLIGCDVAEAKKYRAQVYSQIPEIKDFITGAEGSVHHRAKYGTGFVRTITGRKCRFNDLRFAYKASNRIVQGGNADYIKHACNEVSDYLESTGKAEMLLTCHDSIEMEYDKGCDEINVEAIRVMEAAGNDDMIRFTVPQEVENGIGKNWAEATFGVYEPEVA